MKTIQRIIEVYWGWITLLVSIFGLLGFLYTIVFQRTEYWTMLTEGYHGQETIFDIAKVLEYYVHPIKKALLAIVISLTVIFALKKIPVITIYFKEKRNKYL